MGEGGTIGVVLSLRCDGLEGGGLFGGRDGEGGGREGRDLGGIYVLQNTRWFRFGGMFLVVFYDGWIAARCLMNEWRCCCCCNALLCC